MAGWKMSLPGREIITTPTSPKATPSHPFEPTLSLSNRADIKAVQIGEINTAAPITARLR